MYKKKVVRCARVAYIQQWKHLPDEVLPLLTSIIYYEKKFQNVIPIPVTKAEPENATPSPPSFLVLTRSLSNW